MARSHLGGIETGGRDSKSRRHMQQQQTAQTIGAECSKDMQPCKNWKLKHTYAIHRNYVPDRENRNRRHRQQTHTAQTAETDGT